MPTPPEAIQGYLMRAGLKFGSNDQGSNGQFVLSFQTSRYINPDGDKSLMLLITVGEDGGYIEIAAMNMYSASDAKDVGKLAEFLLNQNYMNKLLRFELDRSDGEIRATAEAMCVDGSVTYLSFMRMLMLFPAIADKLHPAIAKIKTTGRLPRPVSGNKRLHDLIRRAGSLEALEKLVQDKVDSESLSLEQMMEMHLKSIDEQPSDPEAADDSSHQPKSDHAKDEIAPPPPNTPADDSGGELQGDDDGPCTCDDPQLE